VGQDGIRDGILRPIGNRPYNFLHRNRRITNPPQVTNLPHMIGINLRRSRTVPPETKGGIDFSLR
jgi:hypothetical protein